MEWFLSFRFRFFLSHRPLSRSAFRSFASIVCAHRNTKNGKQRSRLRRQTNEDAKTLHSHEQWVDGLTFCEMKEQRATARYFKCTYNELELVHGLRWGRWWWWLMVTGTVMDGSEHGYALCSPTLTTCVYLTCGLALTHWCGPRHYWSKKKHSKDRKRWEYKNNLPLLRWPCCRCRRLRWQTNSNRKIELARMSFKSFSYPFRPFPRYSECVCVYKAHRGIWRVTMTSDPKLASQRIKREKEKRITQSRKHRSESRSASPNLRRISFRWKCIYCE